MPRGPDVIGELSRLRGQLTANDNLLIYYAGHGILDTYAQEGYWLPIDAEQGNPSNWISNSDLTNMVRAIRAKHVMVVADSCYSGTLVRSVSAKIKTAKERESWPPPDVAEACAHGAWSPEVWNR